MCNDTNSYVIVHVHVWGWFLVQGSGCVWLVLTGGVLVRPLDDEGWADWKPEDIPTAREQDQINK